MISCCILMPIHPMIGIDYHDLVPPPPAPPTPVPMQPYGVVQVLMGISGDSKFTTKVFTMNFPAMHMGTDIGKALVHVGNPANLLLPVIIGFSASKSLFGASTVQAEGKPVATACMVFANQNLNCNNPVNLPTGSVCAPNTVMAGMSLGDYLTGALMMGVDMLVSFLFSKLPFKNQLSNEAGTGLFNRLAGEFAAKSFYNVYVHAAGRIAGEIAIQVFIGEVVNKGILNQGGWENTGNTASSALGSGLDSVVDTPDVDVASATNDLANLSTSGSESISNYYNDPSVETF